jgi:hypothetical protein
VHRLGSNRKGRRPRIEAGQTRFLGALSFTLTVEDPQENGNRPEGPTGLRLDSMAPAGARSSQWRRSGHPCGDSLTPLAIEHFRRGRSRRHGTAYGHFRVAT